MKKKVVALICIVMMVCSFALSSCKIGNVIDPFGILRSIFRKNKKIDVKPAEPVVFLENGQATVVL